MVRLPTSRNHEPNDSKAFVRASDQVADQRMHSAAIKAIESSQRLRRKADQLLEELEDVTPALGLKTSGFEEEDSVVTSVASVIESHQPSTSRKG
jgi:hypothetical protein